MFSAALFFILRNLSFYFCVFATVRVITVNGITAESVLYPRINSDYENVIVSEYEPFQIRCNNVTASSPYEIFWLKNEKFLNSANNKSQDVLNFISTSIDDSGFYRCLVKNPYGASLSAKTKVNIACNFKK